MNVAKCFIDSLQVLQNTQTNLDIHYQNIIAGLQCKLPLQERHWHALLNTITLQFDALTQQYDEHYIQQILIIIGLIDTQLFRDNMQQSILLTSTLIKLLSICDVVLIPGIFDALFILIQSDHLLKLALPSLSSNTIKSLLKYDRSRVQSSAIQVLTHILTFAINTYKSYNNRIDLVSASPVQCDPVVDKLNEYLSDFANNVTHLPTPKLASIYRTFIFQILELRGNDFINPEVVISLFNLYLRYNDGFNNDLHKFQSIITHFNKFRYARLQICIESTLIGQLKTLHRYLSEIDSNRTIAAIRKIRCYLRLQADVGITQQIKKQLIKCLKHSIKYEYNPQIRQISNPQQSLHSQNIELSINKALQSIDLELLKIVNNEITVLNEIKLMLKEIQIDISQYFVNKLYILLTNMNDTILIGQERIVKLQIKDILQICSYLFIVNQMSFHNDRVEQFIKLAYNLILDHNEIFIQLFQMQLQQFIFKCYMQSDQDSQFIQTSLVDYYICQHSSKIPMIRVQSEHILSQLAQLLSIQSYVLLVRQFAPSILYRNYSKLDDSSLQIDKGHALQTILHIFTDFDGFIHNQSTIEQTLSVAFKTFDRYYIKSDPEFIRQYLQFIGIFFKKWINPTLNNNLVQCVRQIVLQISSFFNQKQHQLQAYQCFYYAIPLLAKRELKDCKSNQIFGMNDGPNVSITDTLAVIFYEKRQCFEMTLEDESIVAQLQVWKIIKTMYQIDGSMMFYQAQSIVEIYNKYISMTLNAEINQTQLKLYLVILQFMKQYCIQVPILLKNMREYCSELIIKVSRVQGYEQIVNEIQQLCQDFNEQQQ